MRASQDIEDEKSMNIVNGSYYHVFNRSNAQETVFRTEENYGFFLKKYRAMLDDYVDTIAYCLMPTHFHFLIRGKEKCDNVGMMFGKLLSSYTRALNRAVERSGSLFQQHTKALLIDDERYLIAVIAYIHDNPVRAKLVVKPHEWKFSSYQDYVGLRNGTLPQKDLVQAYFPTVEEFRHFSEQVHHQPEKYWR